MTTQRQETEAQRAERGMAVVPESEVRAIDADSHIEEHPTIWDRIDPEFCDRKPAVIRNDNIPHRPQRDAQWFIDGQLFPRFTGPGATVHGSPVLQTFAQKKPVSLECQALLDVEQRLNDMDDAGLDVTVVFSTMFLQSLTGDLTYEAALMRAYNDFMAEQCSKANGRIRWAAPVPLRNVPEAIRELQRTRDMGAVGAMMLGTAGDTLLHDRRFDPFWAEAERLGVTVCVHFGWAHNSLLASCDSPAAAAVLCLELGLLKAFFSFVAGGILDRFPDLKVGLIEGPPDWYPVLLDHMNHWYTTPTAQPWPAEREPEFYLRERRVYVTSEGDEEDLPKVIEVLGEDRVMGSQDFPHVHFEGGKIGLGFQELRGRGDISEGVRRKLLVDNAREFYGLHGPT